MRQRFQNFLEFLSVLSCISYSLNQTQIRRKLRVSLYSAFSDSVLNRYQNNRKLQIRPRVAPVRPDSTIQYHAYSSAVTLTSVRRTFENVFFESMEQYIDHTKFYLRNISEQVVQGKINQTIEQVSQTRSVFQPNHN